MIPKFVSLPKGLSESGTHIKLSVGGWGDRTAQLVKCLLHRHKELNLTPQDGC